MASDLLAMRLVNDLTEIPRVAEAIEALGEKEEWPADWIFNFNLSLDELLTNIVHNGYQDEERHEIDLTVRGLAAGDVEIIVEDDGVAFDPFSEAPEPDLESGVEDRPIGGLGVFLVKQLMHELEYERRGDRNRVTLRLRREG